MLRTDRAPEPRGTQPRRFRKNKTFCKLLFLLGSAGSVETSANVNFRELMKVAAPADFLQNYGIILVLPPALHTRVSTPPTRQARAGVAVARTIDCDPPPPLPAPPPLSIGKRFAA